VGDNTRFLQDAFQDLRRLLERYAEVPEALRAGVPTEELIATMKAAAEETDLEYLTEEIPKAIQQSLEGVERVSKIVRAMKEFSHPGTEEKRAIDINSAIESTITVSTRHQGAAVEIRLTDTGGGIPEAIRPKIFDPFFTTFAARCGKACADSKPPRTQPRIAGAGR